MFHLSAHPLASDAGYAGLKPPAGLALDDFDAIDVDAVLAASRFASLGADFEDDLDGIDVEAVLAASRTRILENV